MRRIHINIIYNYAELAGSDVAKGSLIVFNWTFYLISTPTLTGIPLYPTIDEMPLLI